MKQLLVIFILLSISKVASASEWLYLFSSDTKKYYVDVESVEKVNEFNDNLIKAWFKLEIFNDIEKDGLGVGDKTLILNNFDCKNKKIGFTQIINYKNNIPFGDSYNMPSAIMKDIIPDSTGAESLSRACYIYKMLNED
ncbi:surface-adhesin E family protein [Acinetobacter junii]|uniref:surface-adhesin E family protein n=1 Tax=Acinetobacter junii TaxID=40215 RepID=UPI00124D8CD3|nr:surface-adhesin E family protein [Acinetobacter junii]